MASRKGEWPHRGTSPPLCKLVYGIITSLAKLNYTRGTAAGVCNNEEKRHLRHRHADTVLSSSRQIFIIDNTLASKSIYSVIGARNIVKTG
jgi:hypothetical protein